MPISYKGVPLYYYFGIFSLQESGEYFLLEPQVGDYDYEEPYFEPASEEEELLQQLNKMSIPFIDEEKELK